MSSPILATEFAPAEKAIAAEIEQQAKYFSELTLLRNLIDAVPDVFLVLNEHRQIVFANKAMLELIGVTESEEVRGLRLGDVLDCVHAIESQCGCGTTKFCSTCGAAQAVLCSLRGKEAVQECRITQKNGNALDLQVWATPLQKNGHKYSLFAVKDIGHEQRRRVLERIFFHDIMNMAGTLQGISQLLQDATPDELDELKRMVYALADRMMGEIQAQRMLLAAENGELELQTMPLKSLSFLREIADSYRGHEVADERQIVIDHDSKDFYFASDRALLGRVVGNLLKNALEASAPGDTVTMGCRLGPDETLEIWVHNPTFMARNTQLQVFQRSFSTKGADRGLGTYSIKLLTERYLSGKVWFKTSRENGTTFTCRYPINLS